MKTNVHQPIYTHEGALSSKVTPFQALKRSVMTCMLWEDNAYEDGVKIVNRISALCAQCLFSEIIELALDVHKKGLLRHIPLLLLVEALKKKDKGVSSLVCNSITADAIDEICSRPDQMTELLSLYWKDGRKPLAKQLKKGLAKAFVKFNEYQLAKYNRDEPIKLRDVLFLCHAKPKDEEQAELWKRLISNTLKTPDTWEVKLSAGNDKKQSFEELLREGKMGRLALLLNLRNMAESGIDKALVKEQMLKKSRPMLPFQFLAAAKHVPQWEDIIDESMLQSMEGKEKLNGITVCLVDVSGSMSNTVSSKSEVTCMDAACGIAILLREVCENFECFSFSNSLALIPPRRGMALRDAICKSQYRSGTYLGKALQCLLSNKRQDVVIERVIVVTDEQTHDVLPKMNIDKCYILNVSNCQNGIRNNGEWLTITGFSEASIDYIQEIEKDA